MERPRKLFRFHLSTMLTAVLAVGLIQWVTLDFHDQDSAGRKDGRGERTYTKSYGFPFTAIDTHYRSFPPTHRVEYMHFSVRALGLTGDLIMVALILGWIYWLGEVRRERPRRRVLTSAA